MQLHHALTIAASWLTIGTANSQPVCSFALLSGKPLIGANAAVFAKALGPATLGKHKDERGWGLAADDIARVGLRTEGAVEALVISYGGRVFEADLTYPTTDLAESTKNLQSKLTGCAQQKTSDCWIDRRGNYYIVVGRGDRLTLSFGDKRLAGPDARGTPISCVREHRQAQ